MAEATCFICLPRSRGGREVDIDGVAVQCIRGE